MIDRLTRARTTAHVGPGHDRDDVATAREPAAASPARATLIPREHEEAVRPQLAQQRRDGVGQEPVSTRYATVVSVLAEVRRDPGVGG